MELLICRISAFIIKLNWKGLIMFINNYINSIKINWNMQEYKDYYNDISSMKLYGIE